MNDSATAPHLEDIASVGTRVSWGAILAGTALALGVYFLLATLGAAVGLSTSDKMNPATLQNGAIVWAFLTTIVALFIGGLVTSVFTAGENKMEAVMSGVITWAVLFAFLLILGAAGVRAGFHSMQVMANNSQTAATQSWETAAREAGVPAEQIEDWRRKQPGSGDKAAQEARNQEALHAVTRISWYTFAGTWLSMLAAAVGALIGAGPTFRVVAVHGPLVRTGSHNQAPVSPAYSR
jgi:hypothetical protein